MKTAKVYNGNGVLLGVVETQDEVDKLTAGLDSKMVVWMDCESPSHDKPACDSDSPESDSQTKYLPDWLDPAVELFEEEWRTLYALGVNPGWPESWQRGLLYVLNHPMPEAHKYHIVEACVITCVKLLGYKGLHKRTGKPLTSRSAEIRHSLKDQLIEWLETPPEERKFDSPFSKKQWWKCLWPITHKVRGRRVADWVSRLWDAGAEIWPEKCEDLIPLYHQI